MKIRFFFSLFFLILFQALFGQIPSEGDYSPRSDCANYNAFLTSNTIQSLKYYMDTIYPSGIMKFDLSKSDEYSGIEALYSLLEVPTGSTFELIDVIPSRLNEEKQFERYQQYYNGVKVDGGGYTIAYYRGAGGGGGKGPCDKAYMLSPFIASDINISANPAGGTNIILSDLGTILESETNVEAELVITQNLLNNCQYHFVWKSKYAKNVGKISWVDANTGSVIRTIDDGKNINAPTIDYGQQSMVDETNLTTLSTMLQTPNNWESNFTVITYDFNQVHFQNVSTSDYISTLIPSTTDTIWTTTIATTNVYQAHYVVTKIAPVFEELGIIFDTIFVGANCSGENARTTTGTDTLLNNVYIVFGELDGKTYAVFDIAAHELGHAFLEEYLDYTNLGNGALHEGIADMLSVYVESIIQGEVDWLTGDDNSLAAGRDLENPHYDCYTVIEESPHFQFGSTSGLGQHAASTPLGYWFYLISEGNGGSVPSGIGIEKAIQIVFEALPTLSRNADWHDLRDAVLAIVDEEYEPCSLESSVIRSAWHEICVGPSHFIDCFTIEGDAYPCEEDDYLYLYIGNPTPGVDVYRWTFPIDWTVQGNPSGNTYEGQAFIVTDFPDYDWYPRYFNIKVYSPLLGTNYTQFKRVKLRDCDEDDPSCEDFYALKNGSFIENNNRPNDEFKSYDGSTSQIKTLKVLNITGKTLYDGIPSAFNENSILYQGILIFVYLDESGKVVKTQKRILMK